MTSRFLTLLEAVTAFAGLGFLYLLWVYFTIH